MRLVSYGLRGSEAPGVVVGDSIVALGRLAAGRALDELIANWAECATEVAAIAASSGGERIALAETRLGPPLLRPSKIIGIGGNYRNADGSPPKAPIDPILFFKPASSLVGDGDAVILPFEAARVVGEVELAIVIGQGGHRISRESAMNHIFGYTIANDVTAPEVMLGDSHITPLFFQQGRGKGFPTFCPLGPWIVTRDELADPLALTLEQRVNDETQLSGPSSLMHHDPATLVSEASHAFGLEPGDIILSGSPRPAVGAKRLPLRDGDRLTSEISGIGTLQNAISAEVPASSRPIRSFSGGTSTY